jgi:hypothetical protein
MTVFLDEVDPSSSAAEPSWRAHGHALTCEAAEVASVVKVEKRGRDAGWKSTCLVCGTMWVYFWDPERTDTKGRRVRAEGSVLYQYKLRHQMATV